MRTFPWRHAFLLLGLALLAWLIVSIGPREIVAIASRVGWRGAAVLLPYAAYQLLRARALQESVARDGALASRDALLVRLSGESAQVLTGAGAPAGEPFKAWLMKERGLSGTEALAAALTEYLVYKFVSAVLMVAALSCLLATRELPPVLDAAARGLVLLGLTFLVVAAVAILRRIHLIGALAGAVGRVPVIRRRWPIDRAWVRSMEDCLLGILRDRPGRFLRIALLDIAAHALLVLELWWLLVQFELPAPLWHAWIADGATKPAAGIFFFVPGQAGTNEAVLAATFGALGLPAAAGVVVALTRRLRSTAVATVGLLALWWLDRTRARGR